MTAVSERRPPEKKKRYKQPDGAIAAYMWRTYMWLGSTIGLTVMEPWEEALVLVTLATIFALMAIGLVRFFPQFLFTALSRARYYLLGSDSLGGSMAWTGVRSDEL